MNVRELTQALADADADGDTLVMIVEQGDSAETDRELEVIDVVDRGLYDTVFLQVRER